MSKEDQIITHLININLALQNPHAKFEQYITDLSKRAKLLSDYIDTVTATFRETLGSLRRLLEDTKIDDSLAEIKGGVIRLHQIETNILTWLTQYETRMKKNVQEMDIGQTLSEIKYIGNRLKTIEERLNNIERLGIRSDVVVSVVQQEKAQTAHVNEDTEKGILAVLDEKYRTLIIHRFGLFGEEPKSKVKVARLLQIADTTCGIWERKALRRLRGMPKQYLMKLPEGKLRKEILGG